MLRKKTRKTLDPFGHIIPTYMLLCEAFLRGRKECSDSSGTYSVLRIMAEEVLREQSTEEKPDSFYAEKVNICLRLGAMAARHVAECLLHSEQASTSLLRFASLCDSCRDGRMDGVEFPANEISGFDPTLIRDRWKLSCRAQQSNSLVEDEPEAPNKDAIKPFAKRRAKGTLKSKEDEAIGKLTRIPHASDTEIAKLMDVDKGTVSRWTRFQAAREAHERMVASTVRRGTKFNGIADSVCDPTELAD